MISIYKNNKAIHAQHYFGNMINNYIQTSELGYILE
jgi:hypothetical protein